MMDDHAESRSVHYAVIDYSIDPAAMLNINVPLEVIKMTVVDSE